MVDYRCAGNAIRVFSPANHRSTLDGLFAFRTFLVGIQGIFLKPGRIVFQLEVGDKVHVMAAIVLILVAPALLVTSSTFSGFISACSCSALLALAFGIRFLRACVGDAGCLFPFLCFLCFFGLALSFGCCLGFCSCSVVSRLLGTGSFFSFLVEALSFGLFPSFSGGSVVSRLLGTGSFFSFLVEALSFGLFPSFSGGSIVACLLGTGSFFSFLVEALSFGLFPSFSGGSIVACLLGTGSFFSFLVEALSFGLFPSFSGGSIVACLLGTGSIFAILGFPGKALLFDGSCNTKTTSFVCIKYMYLKE